MNWTLQRPPLQVLLPCPDMRRSDVSTLRRSDDPCSAPATPLNATLMNPTTSVDSKPLTEMFNLLNQTLKKHGGVGARPSHPTRMFHSGNCSQDTTPKDHFFRPFLSTACALFQVPYPLSPLLATLTKTAGCHPTIPILEPNIRQGCESCASAASQGIFPLSSPFRLATHEPPLTFRRPLSLAPSRLWQAPALS
jgi:hypothetical protein